eukprot:5327882-Pyramimonas_sp.AAC.1
MKKINKDFRAFGALDEQLNRRVLRIFRAGDRLCVRRVPEGACSAGAPVRRCHVRAATPSLPPGKEPSSPTKSYRTPPISEPFVCNIT